MKIFYTAKSYKGQTKSGEASVKTEKELVEQLRTEGFVLTSSKILDKEKGGKMKVDFLDRFFGLPLKEKMLFAKNLSIMISSGLPLAKAVKNIAAQTQNKKFIKILEKIQGDLQAGSSLADSLAKYPKVFNELFVNMINVGEASGNLDEVLSILSLQLEKENEIIRKVKGAMIYPAVILVAMIGVGILMMIYVVPQITAVFSDMEVTLPPTTQFIISTSNFLRNHLILFFLIVGVILAGIKFFIGTESGKKLTGMMMLNVPILKNIAMKLNCARFCRIYSSLLKSGVSVVESLKILSRTLTNYYYKQALEEASQSIQKGIPLSTIIYKKDKVFPILVPQMIEVGEETGKTESILMNLAEFYEEEVDQITKNLSSIIEPVLMLIIGSAVGFFAISILQPMYGVLENIK